MAIGLDTVEETLFIPLWCRAQASKKYPSLLYDPKAVELVETIDYDFSPIAEKFDALYRLSSVVRAKHLDDKTRAYIAEHPCASVINLGAGLDTGFCRVDNGQIQWYDLDLPNVIALRQQLIPETGRTHYIAKSLFDMSWYNDIKHPEHTNDGVFIVSAAVLMYFEETKVRPFFSSLADELPGAEMVFNIYTALEASRINEALRRIGAAGATITWALDDVDKIRAWDARIKIIDAFPYFKNIRRDPAWGEETIKRMNAVDLQKMMSIVHVRF
jgi:O-methyltransferase involved in polyketide biosynthesis